MKFVKQLSDLLWLITSHHTNIGRRKKLGGWLDKFANLYDYKAHKMTKPQFPTEDVRSGMQVLQNTMLEGWSDVRHFKAMSIRVMDLLNAISTFLRHLMVARE